MLQIGFFGEVMQEFGCLAGDAQATGITPQPHFAGDTFNTASYLLRLAQTALPGPAPLAVHYYTAIGQDALSEALQRQCRQQGLCLHGQISADRTLGSYQISTDEQGERSFLYQRSHSAVRAYFSEPALTTLEQALAESRLDVLYVSGISLAVLPDAGRQRLCSAIADFVGRGGCLVYDNNFRPLLWDAATAAGWQARLLPFAALALLTDSDERQIWQTPTASAASVLQQAVQRMSPTAVCLVKCGGAPALLARQHWQAAVPAEPVARVLDTSGAGDAFAAAFLWAWLLQDGHHRQLSVQGLLAAARAGHQLAAAVVQQPGALVAHIPTLTLTPAAKELYDEAKYSTL